MEIRYRRSLNKSYMIIGPLEAFRPNYEMRMFEYNKIPGILPFSIIVADGKIEAWYEITGMQTLSQCMRLQQLEYPFMKALFEDLFQSLQQAKRYLLNENSLRMTPEYIVRDMTTEKFSIVYLPGEKFGLGDDLQALLENVMQVMDHKDKQLLDLVYGIYEGIKREGISLYKIMQNMEFFQEPIKFEEENQENIPKEKEISTHKQESGLALREKFAKKIKAFKREKKRKLHELLDFTTVKKEGLPVSYSPLDQVSSSYPTEYLGENKEGVLGQLIYEGEEAEDNFQVIAKQFLIGKSREAVDGVLHSDAVSRIHALIEREEDCYYLEDLNSSNGTFLNGLRLEYQEKVPLKRNDVIQFARAQYRFL
ncbi:MAG: DUF6382 domain-containing protein [Lachnospiraceae bacterium]